MNGSIGQLRESAVPSLTGPEVAYSIIKTGEPTFWGYLPISLKKANTSTGVRMIEMKNSKSIDRSFGQHHSTMVPGTRLYWYLHKPSCAIIQSGEILGRIILCHGLKLGECSRK